MTRRTNVARRSRDARTFFVNQTGDITSSDRSTYTGPGALGSGSGNMTGLVAVGTIGVDGGVWRQVN